MRRALLRSRWAIAVVGVSVAAAACGSAPVATQRGDTTTAVARTSTQSAAVTRSLPVSRRTHRSSSAAARPTAATLATPSAAGLEHSAETYVRRFYIRSTRRTSTVHGRACR